MAMDKYLTCETNGIPLEAILLSLMVTHADGSKGFRMVIVDVADCDDLTDGIDCQLTPGNLIAEFKDRIVLDACGKPALLVYNTADAT